MKFNALQVPANALDSILGDGKRDTTSQHLSHFFDANCSICATKMKSNAEAEKKDREEKEKMKEEIKKKRQVGRKITSLEMH